MTSTEPPSSSATPASSKQGANSSPGAPTLILVPTQLERSRLQALGGFEPGRGLLNLCGFGVVAAAARSAQLVARLNPRRVILLGIAGSYDLDALPLGSATSFGFVRLHGLGALAGAQNAGALALPSQLGIPQWQAEEDSEAAVWEELALAEPTQEEGSRGLLTVCAATGDAASAEQLAARNEGVLAEDMETFGVALACALAGCPLTVVRGISNAVGDRDHKGWCIDAALDAARVRVLELTS